MAQIYSVPALAVEVVFDLKLLVGLVALEGFTGDHDSTAFVLRSAEAGSAAGYFSGLFSGDDLFPLRDVDLA